MLGIGIRLIHALWIRLRVSLRRGEGGDSDRVY